MTDKLVKLSDVEKFLVENYGFGKFQIESLSSLPTIEPLEFTPYDYRGPWASEEAKECIREQHNNKIKIHYHGMDDVYSTN